jgi:hypothetical protein
LLGKVDPFGDFDLLFGAAKLNLKIIQIPVRYRQRTYVSTNIRSFAVGWLLLRMSAKAATTLFSSPELWQVTRRSRKPTTTHQIDTAQGSTGRSDGHGYGQTVIAPGDGL